MTARNSATADQRRRDLAAIHVARQQLAMDDDAYRALLVRVSATCGTSCRSSADLTARQRAAVLDEMRRLGAQRPAKDGVRAGVYPGKPHNADGARAEQIAKIEAQLADIKVSWSYANAIAKRMFGIARIAWLRKQEQLAAIIAALHVEQEKRQLNDAIDALLRTLAWEPERVVNLLGPLRPNWRRHRASLKLVRDFLVAQVDLRDTQAAGGS
jgi:phage gp16-like protein